MDKTYNPNPDIKIEIISKGKNCLYDFKPKDVFGLKDIIPHGFCSFAFHNALPYYITLANNGWFSWVKHNDGVIVQCPNPHNSVEMKIIKTKNNIIVEIIGVRGKCTIGLEKGNVFNFEYPSKMKFCPDAFNSIFPYINLITDNNKIFTCPHSEGTKFKIYV